MARPNRVSPRRQSSLRTIGFETPTLILLLILIGAMGIVLSGGETHRLDEWLILAMRDPHDVADPWGPRWLEELGRDFTSLGSVGVLTFVTLTVAGYLWLHGKYRMMTLVLVAFLGGALLSLVLKSGFDRPRPALVPHGTYVQSASFPSAHSMMAAATYLTLGALLARVHPRRRTKAYVLGTAVMTTFVVGLSRIYMGVHWPSDVLGGWALGAAWALLCWFVARWMQKRGSMEQPI
jgi:undecaprenyl-diphosphatase